jgi:putative flippase GtrA
MPLRVIHSVARMAYARYVSASAAALCIDMLVFLALLRAGMWAVAASSLGYCAGLALHWLISSRIVFADRAAVSAAGRTRQKALFIASALVGLAITSAIVGLGTYLGIDARMAKLVAIGLSFQTTWLLRRSVVFA